LKKCIFSNVATRYHLHKSRKTPLDKMPGFLCQGGLHRFSKVLAAAKKGTKYIYKSEKGVGSSHGFPMGGSRFFVLIPYYMEMSMA